MCINKINNKNRVYDLYFENLFKAKKLELETKTHSSTPPPPPPPPPPFSLLKEGGINFTKNPRKGEDGKITEE